MKMGILSHTIVQEIHISIITLFFKKFKED